VGGRAEKKQEARSKTESYQPPASASAPWYACVTSTLSSPFSDMVKRQMQRCPWVGNSRVDSRSQACLRRRGRRRGRNQISRRSKLGGHPIRESVAESQLQQAGGAIGASRGVDTDARLENMYLATRGTRNNCELSKGAVKGIDGELWKSCVSCTNRRTGGRAWPELKP